MKQIAPVSKFFYRFAQDKHLLRRIKFEFKVLSDKCFDCFPGSVHSVEWSEDRKEKYYNDFLEVIKNTTNLKFLSLKIKSNETDRQNQIFNVLSSIKNKYLEEFCLSTYPRRFLPSLVFGYLDKCSNLKIIKLDKIKLNDHL